MTRFHRARLVPILAAMALTLAASTQARGQTWIGPGTDWNTAANWSPAGVPTSTGMVNFTGTGPAGVNISGSANASTLTFSNPTGAYTLTSSAGQALNLSAFGNNLIVAAGVTGTETLNLANVSTGSLIGGPLTINNNSTSSATTLVIGPNTVIGTPDQVEAILIVRGPGNTQISGSFSSSNPVGTMSDYGPGTLTLSGNGSNLGLAGGVELGGGTCVLDYSANTNPKFGSTTMYSYGGVLSLKANSSTSVIQAVSNGTFVISGQTDIGGISTGGTHTITLNAGAISQSGSGTVDFGISGNASLIFNVTTSTGATNGLLGSGPAFATVDGGQSWATVSGGAITGLGTYGTNIYTLNTNVDVTTSSSQTNFTVNSLRFSVFGASLTLAGTNTLQSGGILLTGSAQGTITGGTLTAPGGGELLVHSYNSFPGFAINSALVSSVGLTKTGPGTLALGGNNTGLTGPINVNRGNLTVTTLAAINSSSQISFLDARSGSALQTFTIDLGNNTNGTINPPIYVSAFSTTGGGTVFSTGNSLNSRITLGGGLFTANVLVTSLVTPIQFTGDSSDTSGFNLSGISGISFSGAVTLSHGYLGIPSHDSGFTFTNPLILGTGDAVAGGLVFLSTSGVGGTVTGPITISSTTRVVSNDSDSSFISGTVTSAGSGAGFQFVKAGTGQLTFNGNGAGQLGGLTMNGGEMFFDYSSNTAAKIGGGILTLNGGSLGLFANAGTPVTQMIPGGTVVSSAHTDISTGGTGAITLAVGAITRGFGGTVDFALTGGATFNVTTTTGTTNGLLGSAPAFATVNGGSTWATTSGGGPTFTITGLTTYATNSYISGGNTDVTASASPIGGATTNSLRFNTGNLTLTLSSTNTIQSGGILVTPLASGGTVTGGTLTAPSSGELLVHQYSAGNFTVNSALNSTTGLTKTGPGMLALGGNNTGLTGPINVSRGGITATITAAVNSASAINFNDARSTFGSGGLQQFAVDLGNGVNGTITPPIRVSAFGGGDAGTYFSTGNSTSSTVTLSSVISSPAGLNASIGFTGSVADSSGFILTNVNNSFTGDVFLTQGSLGIMADANLGNPANSLILNTNDPNNGGLVFLTTGITVARPVRLFQTTRIVSNGTDSNTIASAITGVGDLVKDGTGTLTIPSPNNTFVGNVIVSAGLLTLGMTGGLPSGTNVTVASGGTFSPATASGASVFGFVELNGGTFRVPAGAGQHYTANLIVTNSAGGTVDFTGAGADQFIVSGAFAEIAVNGNSTWLSPANTTTIANANAADISIAIPSGVTLTNGIALGSSAGFGFRITGGGTLFQNSDATNVVGMTAPITVVQSKYRVTDASSNGGVGNLGSGALTLDGSTFDYGGATATTVKAIVMTANGATVQVESATTTLTANGAIAGPAGLTKIGPGTLVLGNSGNSFTSLTITAGTVQTANDNTLGAGPITIGPFGTVSYSASSSTARTFTMNNGTLSVAAGQTLTLNGAAVGGGFLPGPGTYVLTNGAALAGVTTYPGATVNQTGPATYANISNGGVLTVAAGLTGVALNGFTNQGGGSVTLGATSMVNATNFQSYGMLMLTPAVVGSGQFTELTNAGNAPLDFNGGSRTFIGTPGTALQNGQPTFVAGIDLHGQNAVVAGGLFVNNGFVADSTNNGAGTATVIADFGSLVKGAGFFQNTVITQNGGKFQAGNSPGSASFGKFVMGPGGVGNYVFAIDDATGTAGPSPDALGHVSGWSLVKAIQESVGSVTTSGDFTWTATPGDKLTVAIDTLVNPATVGDDVFGPMADFDPTRSYTWPAVNWAGAYAGPADVETLNADTTFDTSGFANAISGTFGWSLDAAAHSLSLTYTPTPVPEPGTLALTGLAAIGWVRYRRRRWATRKSA